MEEFQGDSPYRKRLCETIYSDRRKDKPSFRKYAVLALLIVAAYAAGFASGYSCRGSQTKETSGLVSKFSLD